MSTSELDELLRRLKSVADMDLRTGGFVAHTMDTAAEAIQALTRLRAELAAANRELVTARSQIAYAEAAFASERADKERMRGDTKSALLEAAACIETFVKHSERLRPYDNVTDAVATAERCRSIAMIGYDMVRAALSPSPTAGEGPFDIAIRPHQYIPDVAHMERMQEALKAEVERLKAIRDVRRYGEGHAVISNIRAALSQAKGGADMTEADNNQEKPQ